MNRYPVILLAAALLAVSCSREWDSGRVLFLLKEGEITEQTKSSVTQYATLPQAEELELALDNSSLSRIFQGPLSSWDSSTKMTPGDYIATVSAGDPASEGPGAACFTGSAEFSVTAGQTVSVTIEVTLGNSIVKIEKTDAFLNYFPESSFTISTPLSTDGFPYDGTPVFVSGTFTVSGTAVNQAGTLMKIEPETWRGESATCYTVKYDVTNTGGVTVQISFDDTVQTVDLGEIEMN